MTFLSDLVGRFLPRQSTLQTQEAMPMLCVPRQQSVPPQQMSLPPSELALAKSALSETVSAHVIASFAASGNGRIRQAAIDRCVALNSPDMLPIVASRLNDWVPQVRNAARAAVIALAPACTPVDLLAILPDVLRLRDARRDDHEEWVSMFEDMLGQGLPEAALSAAIRTGDATLSRACFQLARDRQLIESATLISLALSRRDDIRMANCALALIALLPSQQRRPWYVQLNKSHFLLLRMGSLRALLLEPGDETQAIALAALLDKSAGVRGLAATFLQRRAFDVRDFYRSLLLDSATPRKLTRLALGALAAQGVKDDLDLIKSCMADPAPALREAALAAWLKLDVGSKDDIALLALRDPALKVRRFAYGVVRRQGAYVAFAQAQAILLPLRDYALLIQFSRSDDWQWLEALVFVATECAFPLHSDAALAATLQTQARDWRRSDSSRYTAPSPRQAALFATPAAQDALRALNIPVAMVLSHASRCG
jgi:hypothetical protein